MIPFFKELNDYKNITVKLEKRDAARIVKLNYLSGDLSYRCAKLIGLLDELNPLHLTKEEESMEFTNYWVDFERGETASNILNNYDVEYGLDHYRYGKYDLYNELKKGTKGFNELGITNNGFNKMMELLTEYIAIHKDDDLEFKCDIKDLAMTLGDYIWHNREIEFSKKGLMSYNFRDYITEKNYLAVDLDDKIAEYLYNIEQFFNVRKHILTNKYTILDYIEFSSKILKGQNRLSKELEEECNACMEAINNFEIYIPPKRIMKDVRISDSYYLTPNKHLFHVDDHKNNNIRFEFSKIVKKLDLNLDSLDPKYYFDIVREHIDNGYLTLGDIYYYYNFYDKCFFLKNDNYDALDWKMKSDLQGEAKCYDKTLLELAIGIESAYGSLYEFFYNLRLNANYYEMEIFKICDMTFKDFMVRCCGFHKIETVVDKTITTSCINHEEEFSEYIKRGWKIQFIPPIVLNDGTLEEYNKDFLTMRRVLKSNRFDRNC